MRALKFTLPFVLLTSPAFAQDVDLERLPSAKKLDWSGSLGATASVYNASGIDNRSNPFNWSLYGSFNLRLFETFDAPFAFTVGKYNSNVTKPYYQLGISPRYKWATLHLGHRNLTFNPYTLAGHTFLGAGVEMNPGKFRFAAMYGRLRAATQLDTAAGVLRVPQYRRMGYGVKMGVGSQQNFFDLILFKGKDDVTSFPAPLNPEEVSKVSSEQVTPAENVALGLSGQATIAKHLRFNADFGLSAYTRNALDSFLRAENKFMAVNSTTRVNWAGKAGLGYSFKSFSLRADYERILPDYGTMGTYFFNNDLENITVSPSGSFAGGKVSVNGSVGRQRNNLLGNRAETTKRVIGAASVSVNPSPQWGITGSYNNFGITQQAGTVALGDSVRIRQVNQTLSIVPYYTISRDTTTAHTFTLAANIMNVTDRNPLTRQYGNMSTQTASLSHTTAVMRDDKSISSGINYNRILVAGILNTQAGATLGYGQSFFKKALTASTSVNYNLSSVDGTSDGSILNLSLAAGYRAGERHNFSLGYSFIRTQSKQFDNYTETMGTLTYGLMLK